MKNNSIHVGLAQTGIAPSNLTKIIFSFSQKEKIMKKSRSFLIVSVVMFIALCGFVPSSPAQSSDDLPPTAVELEQFRADLAKTIQNLNASVAKMKLNPVARKAIAQSGKDFEKTNTAAQRQLGKMSYQELEQLYNSFNTHFPNWRKTAGAMDKLAEKIGGKYLTNGGVVNEAITPDNCAEAFAAAPSWTDWSITKSSEIGAQAVYEGIPEPINLVALGVWSPIAIGAGIAEFYNVLFERCQGDADGAALQTSISNIKSDIIQRVDTNADYVIDRLTGVANSVKTEIVNNDNSNKTMLVDNANSNKTMILTAISDAQTSINNTAGSNTTTITTAITNAQNTIIANDNSNKTMIVNNDNSNATTLNTNLTNAKNQIINNDNSNTTNIINNDNSNKTMIINNANANTNALTDLILRSQIEADLATESNSVKVAWYMTPTANGGKLDLVQQIVTQTLANIQAAGGSIGNAQSFLDRANADKAAGNFKSAYDNYRKAYKAAVN